MNVVPVISCASQAKSVSSHAAIGCFLSTGLPSLSKAPKPVPSGLRLLWADRLSGASSSQNVAVTTERPACRPNKRHMLATIRWRHRRGRGLRSAAVTPRRLPPSFAPLFEMGTLGPQRRVVTVPGVDHCAVGVDVEHPAGHVAQQLLEVSFFPGLADAAREQAVTGEQLHIAACGQATERQRHRAWSVAAQVDDVEAELADGD